MSEYEEVHHPSHYGGDSTYETIKVIEAWGLGFNLGNTVKYISRAGKKPTATSIKDLEKARWYLDRDIANRRAEMDAAPDAPEAPSAAREPGSAGTGDPSGGEPTSVHVPPRRERPQRFCEDPSCPTMTPHRRHS